MTTSMFFSSYFSDLKSTSYSLKNSSLFSKVSDFSVLLEELSSHDNDGFYSFSLMKFCFLFPSELIVDDSVFLFDLFSVLW